MSDNTELKAAIEYILNQGALEREFIEDADALDAAWALYEALGPAEILALIAENDAARKELGSLRTDNAQLIYALKQQEQSYLVLRGERDRLRAEVAGLRTGYEAYEQVNAELKAEVEGLREEVALDDKIIADRDRLLNMFDCPAHGQCVPYAMEQIEALRKDAGRYRWLRRAGNTKAIALVAEHCLDALDEAIDAALGQGGQS